MSDSHHKNLAFTAHYDEPEPLVKGGLGFHDITELVSYHTEKKTPLGWYFAFIADFTC